MFPDGLNQVDLIEECRALTMLDDFDTMYDLTMQLLKGKTAAVMLKNLDGVLEELCRINSPEWRDLRGVEMINAYPVLIVWLTEAVAKHISKEVADACERSVAAAGSETFERQTEEKAADNGGGYIVKTYFGDVLLYACYEFYYHFKHKPDNWTEVFDFLRFMKVQEILKEIAVGMAKTGENG
jgi:hypothetical protein